MRPYGYSGDKMRVLVACEYSGRVRDAFTARGHYAISCDLLPTDRPGPHYMGSVETLLAQSWDLVIGFPPCTDLASSGARWWPEKIADGRQARALSFFEQIYSAKAPKVCVENPVGALSRLFRKPDQYVEPFMFGEPWKKRTGLWLRGLEPLKPTNLVAPTGYWVGGDAKVSGAHRDPKRRSQTFQGLADAMAEQWG